MAVGTLTPCWAEPLRLLDAGIGTLPIGLNGAKKPIIKWGVYQDRLPRRREILAWPSPDALAVVCGAGSGNVEDIEFDAPELFVPWREAVERRAPGLARSLVIIGTPRSGRAVLYRHTAPPNPRTGKPWGNQVLAEGLRDHDGTGVRTWGATIQTRGHGGYQLIPCALSYRAHPAKRPYVYIQGDLAAVPTITPEQREFLLDAARDLNELPPRPHRKPEHQEPAVCRLSAADSGRGWLERPGDAYNARTTWAELLEPLGWTALFTRDGEIFWRRPGKDHGHSATTNHGEADCLHVFTRSARPLEADTSYTRFGVYAALHHGGDLAAAGWALYEQGYGSLDPAAYEHAFTPCPTAPTELRERASRGRIKRATLALLDSTGPAGYRSAPQADAAIAAGLIIAGLSECEALAVLLDSARGQDAIERKDQRYGLTYWQRTVAHAAELVGPVTVRTDGRPVRPVRLPSHRTFTSVRSYEGRAAR